MISNYHATVSRNGKSLSNDAVVNETDSQNATQDELLKFLTPAIEALISALDMLI